MTPVFGQLWKILGPNFCEVAKAKILRNNLGFMCQPIETPVGSKAREQRVLVCVRLVSPHVAGGDFRSHLCDQRNGASTPTVLLPVEAEIGAGTNSQPVPHLLGKKRWTAIRFADNNCNATNPRGRRNAYRSTATRDRDGGGDELTR